MEKLLLFEQQKANKTKIWLLFLFLGWSYGSLGQMGKQILFYLTLGGFMIGTFIRFFTLNSAIKKYNKQLAVKLGLTADEMLRVGVL